jgi:flavin reductase (DIM6/NTAB) family NADH-FMN oxidoreductase RutF
MKNEWIQALGKMSYGIYVLTTHYKEEINGMIASWVSQISFDPLLIMVSVHPNRYSHHLIEQSGCFALHILDKEQTPFMSRFKGPEPGNKFLSLQWEKGKTGCPILKNCIAYLDCRLKTSYAPGNHTLFIGEVVDGQMFSNGVPLSTSDYDGVYLGHS